MTDASLLLVCLRTLFPARRLVCDDVRVAMRDLLGDFPKIFVKAPTPFSESRTQIDSMRPAGRQTVDCRLIHST